MKTPEPGNVCPSSSRNSVRPANFPDFVFIFHSISEEINATLNLIKAQPDLYFDDVFPLPFNRVLVMLIIIWKL